MGWPLVSLLNIFITEPVDSITLDSQAYPVGQERKKERRPTEKGGTAGEGKAPWKMRDMHE